MQSLTQIASQCREQRARADLGDEVVADDLVCKGAPQHAANVGELDDVVGELDRGHAFIGRAVIGEVLESPGYRGPAAEKDIGFGEDVGKSVGNAVRAGDVLGLKEHLGAIGPRAEGHLRSVR